MIFQYFREEAVQVLITCQNTENSRAGVQQVIEHRDDVRLPVLNVENGAPYLRIYVNAAQPERERQGQ